ncbi:DUF4214 domain-containing protein [Sagittula sp.]|uniref:DUF4214 domain-containing protein n=1 Tax=Sagittula sp. TaxID=2038081 RepID=UPI0040595921
MLIKDNNSFLMASGEGSRIELNSADSQKVSFTQLSQSTEIGDRHLHLSESVNWKVGDRIALASTSLKSNEAEVFTIKHVSVDGRVLELDRSVGHFHSGVQEEYSMGDKWWTMDMRAEVALLSRNIKIQGASDSSLDGYGGHTVVMNGAEQYISGVEYYNMGQAGAVGRYPAHWHSLRDDGLGQYFKNSSIHGSFNKGLTIHDTNNLIVTNNVVFDTVGHGFFFEDGSETNNYLIGNIAFGQRAATSIEDAAIASDHVRPTSFWITNPKNHFIDNHAAGSEGSGFWFTAEANVKGVSASTGDYDGYQPRAQAVGTISGITAHSNEEINFSMGWSISDDGNLDMGSLLSSRDEDGNFNNFSANDLTIYNGSGDAQLWIRALGGVFSDVKVANASVGALLRGYQIIKDSLFVGRTNDPSLDTGQEVRHGLQLYDEAFEVENTLFANYENLGDFAFSVRRGISASSNYLLKGVGFDHVPSDNIFSNQGYRGERMDVLNGTARAIMDLDGSLYGTPGLILTPVINDRAPGGIDVIDPGFNSSANAILSDNGKIWLNPSDTNFGVFSFDSPGKFSISKSSGGALSVNGNAKLLVESGSDITYLVDPMNWDFDLATLSLSHLFEGNDVFLNLVDMPARFNISGATEAYSMEQMEENGATSFYRDGDQVRIKLVASKASNWPASPSKELLQKNFGIDVHIFDREKTNAPAPSAVRENIATISNEVAVAPVLDYVNNVPINLSPLQNFPIWSEESSWAGNPPSAEEILVIRDGEKLTLDQSVTVSGILIHGEGSALSVLDRAGLDIEVTADWILVLDGGLLQGGTASNPLDTNFTLTLAGKDKESEIDVLGLLSGSDSNAIYLPLTNASDLERIIGTASEDLIFPGISEKFLVGGKGNDIINGSVTFEDFDSTVDMIFDLFQSGLDRRPSTVGLRETLDRILISSINYEYLSRAIIRSKEFQDKYGELSDDGFVSLLLSNKFGENSRPDLFQENVANLASGGRREDVLIDIASSVGPIGEIYVDKFYNHRASLQNEYVEEVVGWSLAALNRAVTSDEIFELADSLVQEGGDKDAFTSSPLSLEFLEIYSSLNNQDFVSSLFAKTLGRAPTLSGLSRWIDFLESGLTRSDVVYAISHSREFLTYSRNDVLKAIQETNAGSILEGGDGSDTLFGSIFSDTFVFGANDTGSDVVLNFDPWDKIYVKGGDFDRLTLAGERLRQSGDDIVLNLDNGSVVFRGVELGEISEDSFLF